MTFVAGLLAAAPVDPGAPTAVGVLVNVGVIAAIALGLFIVVRAAILSAQKRKGRE